MSNTIEGKVTSSQTHRLRVIAWGRESQRTTRRIYRRYHQQQVRDARVMRRASHE